MYDPMYDYPIGKPTLYVKGRVKIPDPSLKFDWISIFGVVKFCIQPPNDLQFTYLPNEISIFGVIKFRVQPPIDL